MATKPSPGYSTELHRLLAARSWNEAEEYLTSHRDDVQLFDEWCRSPLALSCMGDAPQGIIRKLLVIHPRAAASPDEDGNFPLHLVCKQGSSAEIAHLLIHYNPAAIRMQNKFSKTPLQLVVERGNLVSNDLLKLIIDSNTQAAEIPDKNGMYPLHHYGYSPTNPVGIRALIDAYPAACLKRNNRGETPLFLAVLHDQSREVFEALVDRCPKAATVRNEDGILPITLAWNLFMHIERKEGANSKVVDRLALNRRAVKDARSKTDLVGPLGEWFEKIEILLKAASCSKGASKLTVGRKWKVVHAAACGHCPPEVLRFSLKIFPTQLKQKNDEGNLPLHVAASSPIYIKQESEPSNEPMISKFLKLYPEGARKLNRAGRFPLTLALESGKTLSNGVKLIIDAAPKAVITRDIKTHMYPFMLAAARDDQSTDEEKNEHAELIARSEYKHNDWMSFPAKATQALTKKVRLMQSHDQLNTVFELLRAGPNLVSCGLVDPMDDKEKLYLREKYVFLRDENINLRRQIDAVRKSVEKLATPPQTPEPSQNIRKMNESPASTPPKQSRSISRGKEKNKLKMIMKLTGAKSQQPAAE
mmetsp:Transcript_3882/g.8177  ORF Transcript_3882/g.8177 Transcript_3882/m.8177 type:complete len:588 (+) Transcript_3882:164-1927(+)